MKSLSMWRHQECSPHLAEEILQLIRKSPVDIGLLYLLMSSYPFVNRILYPPSSSYRVTTQRPILRNSLHSKLTSWLNCRCLFVVSVLLRSWSSAPPEGRINFMRRTTCQKYTNSCRQPSFYSVLACRSTSRPN
jgi:hypothetical protein